MPAKRSKCYLKHSKSYLLPLYSRKLAKRNLSILRPSGQLHQYGTMQLRVTLLARCREVMGSISVGNSNFSLSYALVMLISSPFTFQTSTTKTAG